SIPENVTDRLPIILSHVLQRKKTNHEHLLILEDILVKNNLTLPEALMRVTPACHRIVLNCRWQIYMMPCEVLFKKELTDWGACCVARPYDLNVDDVIASRMEVTRRLSIAVQCSDQTTFNGCERCCIDYRFITSVEVLVRKRRNVSPNTGPDYEVHPIAVRKKNFSCNCLPACKKVFTYMALESSAMDAFQYTNDKIYAGINASISSVLRIVVRMSESRLFVVHPTETWITLLSSLGGVFNMFLGVGLFSALEVLYLLFVRLPIAILKPTNMANSET
ncbi:jg20533, partial [Pararge aegeria aegeria]